MMCVAASRLGCTAKRRDRPLNNRFLPRHLVVRGGRGGLCTALPAPGGRRRPNRYICIHSRHLRFMKNLTYRIKPCAVLKKCRNTTVNLYG